MVEKLIPNPFPNNEDCEYLKLRATKIYSKYTVDHLLLPHIKLF